MKNDIEWKTKIQGMLKTFQLELKKTTKIGKKMLSASQTNSLLNDAYKELGKYLLKMICDGKLELDDSKTVQMIKKIKTYENDLEKIEGDVNKIKFQRPK